MMANIIISARSSQAGSPAEKPLSITARRPWPTPSMASAATTSAIDATTTRPR
jgi:hypothetical protein